SAFNRKRRESDHELIAAKTSCGFNCALEIEVLNDVDADVFQNHLMDRVSLDALVRSPARPREPVDVEIVSDEGELALLHPRQCIGEVARYFVSQWSRFRTALPSADVKQNNVAGTRFHACLLFPCFKIGPRDWSSRFDPIDALQLRDIVQDSPCHN